MWGGGGISYKNSSVTCGEFDTDHQVIMQKEGAFDRKLN